MIFKKKYLPQWLTLIFVLILLSRIFIPVFFSDEKRVVFDIKEEHTLIGAEVAAWHFFEPSTIEGFIQNKEYLLGLNYGGDSKYAIYQKSDSCTWRLLRYIDIQNDPLFSEINQRGNFFVKDFNNIYITCPLNYPNNLFIINLQDSIRKEYTIHWTDTNLFLQLFAELYSPVSIKSKLYIPLANWEGLTDLKHKFSKPSLVEIKFENDSAIESTVFGIQPEIYKKNYYKQVQGSFLTTDKQYLYQTFEHDHNIYVYDGHHLIKTIHLPSEHIEEFVPIDTSKNISSPGYVADYFDSNYIYGKFFYDPYRQLFYRILVFPAKNTRTYDFAVMVFDKDLKFLSEQIFDGYKYKYGQFIVAEEGVYIGTKSDVNSPHCFMQRFTPRIIDGKGELGETYKKFKRKFIRAKDEPHW